MTAKETKPQVIGGMRGLRAASPFSRSPAVLRQVDSTFVAPRGDGGSRQSLSEEDWKALLNAQEAFSLPDPVEAPPSPEIWLIRLGAKEHVDAIRAELKDKNAFVREWLIEDVEVILVSAKTASIVAEAWKLKQFNDAWNLAAEDRWQEALSASQIAWALETTSPQTAALFSGILEKIDAGRAIALLRAEARSTNRSLDEMLRLRRSLMADLEAKKSYAMLKVRRGPTPLFKPLNRPTITVPRMAAR